MVAIKNHEADRFLAGPLTGICVFLIHGSDAGLVNERVRMILRLSVDDPNDPFQLVRFSGDEIASDNLKLLDEANSIGLFQTRRAIRIDVGSRDVSPAIQMIFNAPPEKCAIVIEAGNLRRDAPLRSLCERQKICAAIECYPDQARDLELLIDTELKAQNLTIEPDARRRLLDSLGADRLTTRSELSKLLTYAHGQQSINLHDVETIVADASAVAMDNAMIGAFGGDFDLVEATAGRVFATGVDASALLAIALRNCLTIHRMCIDVERGLPLKTALDRYGRSLGGVGRLLSGGLKLWSSQKMARLIDNLSEAVGRSRREPYLAEEIAIRALWAIALASRNRG